MSSQKEVPMFGLFRSSNDNDKKATAGMSRSELREYEREQERLREQKRREKEDEEIEEEVFFWDD